MIKKQGITMTVMVITIIILTILAGTITFSVTSTINYSRLTSWVNEIAYIQDAIDEVKNSFGLTDYILDSIIINTNNIGSMDISEQFQGETISTDSTITLRIINLGMLNITNTVYGNLNSDTDVYAISEETGRVYYIQGVEIDGKIYYTLTDALKSRFEISLTNENLSSVVFVPSALGYTNKPITVAVKVPNTYTDIVIATSNEDIQITSRNEQEKVYIYNINENLVTGNYTVTVTYNNGAETLTSKYEVKGYDVKAPVIQELTDENFVYKETEKGVIDYLINVSATDESGIRVMKYTKGVIDNKDALEYFKNSGNLIIGGKINLAGKSSAYTIYAEDNAGNFSILVFDEEALAPVIEKVTLNAMDNGTDVEVITTLSQGKNVTYEYSYRVDEDTNYMKFNSEESVTIISGLKCGTIYEIKVTAKNPYGYSTGTANVKTVQPTLGEIVLSAEDFGKTVNYSVEVDGTTYTDWQLYYANSSYVFLIKQNGLGQTYLGYTDIIDLTSEQYSLYNICKLGKAGYEIYGGEINCNGVAWLISNYSNYASTSDKYKDKYGDSYVVGAIGGPTIELLAAGWNAKRALNPTLYNKPITPVVSEYGYMINDGTTTDYVITGLNSDDLYLPICWLASPSSYMMSTVMCTAVTAITYNHTVCNGLRPVVCLRADIPAHVRTTTDTVTTDYVLD